MLFWGNAVSLAGCVLMVLIGFVKKKERVLALQCGQFALLGIGNLILGAVSGFISGVVSVLRNLIFPRVGHKLAWKLIFIAAQLVLTLLAGWVGPISLLPLIAGVIFTWFIDTKSDAVLKAAIIAAQLLWAVYDWSYSNFVACTFEILTVLSNAVGIYMIQRAKK